MLFIITFISVIYIIISYTTLRVYREDCLVTRIKPDIVLVFACIFPLVQLLLLNNSMLRINKHLPHKPSLGELVLGIKEDDYWEEQEEKIDYDKISLRNGEDPWENQYG